MADTSLAKSALGFEARCSMEKGIRHAINYWRNEKIPVTPAN